MMFIALARAAGVDAYAQMSGDTLAMRLVDHTLMRAQHVKAGIDANRQQYTVDAGWPSVVAERSPRGTPDAQPEALLHNNHPAAHLHLRALQGSDTQNHTALGSTEHLAGDRGGRPGYKTSGP